MPTDPHIPPAPTRRRMAESSLLDPRTIRRCYRAQPTARSAWLRCLTAALELGVTPPPPHVAPPDARGR